MGKLNARYWRPSRPSQALPYPAHSEEAQQALRYCERHYDTRTFVPPVVRLLLGASLVQCIPTDSSDGAGRLAAFDAIPGQVFKAKVIVLPDAVAQGQLQPTGALLDPEERVGQRRAGIDRGDR